MKKRVLVCIASLVALAVLMPSILQAQTTGWQQPFEISPPQTAIPTPASIQASPRPTLTPRPETLPQPRYGSSWFSDIATGPNGRVYITWYSGKAGATPGAPSIDLLMYRELRDGQWTGPNDIMAPATGGYTVRNSLVVDQRGIVHVIFRSGTNIMYSQAPWDQAWLPQSWSTPRTIAESAYYVELGIDKKGFLHAFWSEAVLDQPGKPRLECPNCSDLYYRRSEDGGASWTAPINLSASDDGENRPQVTIDSLDRVHAVWDQGVDWYAGAGTAKFGVYRRSDDGGKTWSNPVRLAPSDDTIKQTVVGVDRQNNPLVVYRSATTNDIYYQLSRDGGNTWGVAQKLPFVRARNLADNDLDKYALATDSAGNIHLLLSGTRTSQPTTTTYRLALLHMVWNGTAWSPPQSVMENDLYPEWPSLAIANGNVLHATWFTRSQEDLFKSDRARYRVWYSSTQLSSPRQTEVPLATLVAAPAVTQVVEPSPLPATTTPLSAAARNTAPIEAVPTWEVTGLMTLMFAIIPVLLLLGVVIGVRILRSR